MGNNKENKDNDTIELKSYVKVEAEPKNNKKYVKKHTENKHIENKTQGNKMPEKKVQEKKAQGNKMPDKKPQEKKVQDKKVQEKKVQEKKVQDKKNQEKKPQEKKTQGNKMPENKIQEKKHTVNKENVKKENTTKTIEKDIVKKDKTPKAVEAKADNTAIINIAKIVLPIVACAIVVATFISYIGTHSGKENNTSTDTSTTIVLSDEPLQENAYPEVNELMTKFYNALATGDMDTVRSLRDYNDETELIQFEKRSEYIDAYDEIVCYTKPGLDDTSYFVYVSFDAHVKGCETEAPGLNAYFVYTNDDGNLIIDGNIDDDVDATFKLVTNQDDVVDLYNRVDVSYKEAVASDDELASVLNDIPMQIKTAVGEELAQIYAQNSEEQTTEESTEDTANSTTTDSSDLTENQTVNQTVKTTDTVNVRSSDSETADKIGKAAVGTELKRTEIKVNGWSKVEFEGKEAYIKSDYLEVVASDDISGEVADASASDTTTTETASGTVMALTNVNVRASASQTSTKLGTAVALTKYDLLGIEGEWYKIKFNGNTGYVKAEYFQKQ